MGKTLHKVCIYSISVAMTSITVAFVLSHVLPPMSPELSAQHISDYYMSHTTRLRIGALFGVIGAVAYAPFSAAIAWEVKRMTRSDEATYVQIILGVVSTLALFAPWSFFAAAAFRPDRDPEVLHAMYDLAWLPLYTWAATFALQFLFLAWAMRVDKRERKVFPSWFPKFTVFTGAINGLGVFVVLTKDGPLAWNGVLAYWIPLVVFGAWTNLIVKYMVDNLKQEPDEPVAAEDDTSYLDSRVERLAAQLAEVRAQVAGAPGELDSGDETAKGVGQRW